MEKELICAIPTTVAIVLGELLLASLITIIVMANGSNDSSSLATSSESPISVISFTEYTALTQGAMVFKETPYKPRFNDYQRELVFSPTKWVTEDYNDNGIFFRTFSTEDDDSYTYCINMSSHINCYRRSSSTENGIYITGPPVKKSISCSKLFPDISDMIPSRRLDKCDLYVNQRISQDPSDYTFSHDANIEWLVESGTNYPVLQNYKKYGDGISNLKLFHEFKPGKPKDESRLKPLPGVTTVYDFRNGEGDVDEDTSFDLAGALNKPGPFDAYMKAIRENDRIREMLHLPFFGDSPVNPSRVRSTAVRDDTPIPEEYDARTYWSSCANIIGTITDQGQCGSCWAMASAGVLSDRLCISKGIKRQLSPQYLIYCGERTHGCHGGKMIPAWNDLIEYGTVSESCVPFTGRQGYCPTACKDYSPIDDSYLIRPTGYVFPWGETDESRVEAIQREIMRNGPVMASFITFNDFQSFFKYYPDDVYHRSKEATASGGHAVRIIGWGTTDEGEDYWLVANSWGIDFADLGVFKIRRGNNECNIEEQVGGLLF